MFHAKASNVARGARTIGRPLHPVYALYLRAEIYAQPDDDERGAEQKTGGWLRDDRGGARKTHLECGGSVPVISCAGVRNKCGRRERADRSSALDHLDAHAKWN